MSAIDDCEERIRSDAYERGLKNGAKEEREKVLDKLKASFQVTPLSGRETMYEIGFRQGMTHAICEIESLRGEVRE